MPATSKNILLQGHSHRYWWPETLIFAWAPVRVISFRSSVLMVSRWLWPGNRTFLKVAGVVATWWIIPFFVQCKACLCMLQVWVLAITRHMLSTVWQGSGGIIMMKPPARKNQALRTMLIAYILFYQKQGEFSFHDLIPSLYYSLL